jgi:hypothetical protein
MFHRRDREGRCPACGVPDAACGPPFDGVAVGERIEEVAAVGGPLEKYRVASARGVETVMKLTAADALARGLGEDDLVEQSTASGEPDPDLVEFEEAPPVAVKGRRGAANKARASAPNKAGDDGGGA